MGEVIGMISLKGGVGKTSSVVALGAAIAELGKKVLLVDGNLSAPNLGLHLNVIDPDATIHHVLDRSIKVRDAIYEVGDLHLIPGTVFNRKKINPLMLRDRIKYLRNDYDFILIDSSPALNEETLAVMLASDKLFVVTTPDYPTLSTTIKAAKLAKQRGTPISGLILNKVHNKKFELSLDDIEQTSGLPILAVIPHNVKVLKALFNFTPSTNYSPNSRGSIEYKKLASTLTGENYRSFELRNFLGNLVPLRQQINRDIFYHNVFR